MISCPDCSGVLSLENPGQPHPDYACQVGHRYSTRSLLVAKEKELERTLWSAAALLDHIQEVYGRMLREEANLPKNQRAPLKKRMQEARGQRQVLIDLIEGTHVWT